MNEQRGGGEALGSVRSHVRIVHYVRVREQGGRGPKEVKRLRIRLGAARRRFSAEGKGDEL